MAVRHARNTKWLAAALAVALAPWSAAHSGVLEDQLFQSVRNDDLAAVRSALDAGANVFATNVLGNRAADVAVDLGHFDVAHYLLSVMDHVRAAREAREEPAVVVPDPPSASPGLMATQPVATPPQQTPQPETAFDAAAADAVFTPVRASAPEKTTARQAEMPAVPKILPAAHEVPPPPPVRAESPAKAQEKPIAGTEAPAPEPALAAASAPAPAKPKRTLDDIMRTASKADSALHVHPGTPVAKPAPQAVSIPAVQTPPQTPPSQATPQPVGLFAKGASPQTQPAQEPIAPKPSAVAVKAEQPPVAPVQAPALRKASVLHVDAGPSAKPATRMTASKADAPKEHAPKQVVASVHSERLKAALVSQPEKAEASRDPQEALKEDPGWFAKMKSYLGVGEGTKPSQTGGQTKAAPQAPTQAKNTAPVQTAALTPSVAKAQTPSHRGPSPYMITADLALGRALPYDDLKGAPCVDKRRQGVVCMEPANWPKDLAPYFADMRSALYRGAKVVIGYRGGQANFLYAVFPSSNFKAVVGALSGRFGPPIKSQRGVRPLGEDLQANLVRTWSGTDENTGHPVALEVSMYDDQRGAFPVMDEGVLKLTYTGSDSVFRYVEPIELQRFK